MTCSQLQKPAPDDWRRFVARISADTLCYYRAYIFFWYHHHRFIIWRYVVRLLAYTMNT